MNVNTDTGLATFAGEPDPLGSLARLFDDMPEGSFITIAKRSEGGRTFAVVTRQIPARGPVSPEPFDTATIDGEPLETRAVLTLATLALEQEEANRG